MTDDEYKPLQLDDKVDLRFPAFPAGRTLAWPTTRLVNAGESYTLTGGTAAEALLFLADALGYAVAPLGDSPSLLID